MNILYSRPLLGSSNRNSLSFVCKNLTSPFKTIHYRPYYAFSSNKPKNEPENIDQYIISEEELVSTDYLKPKTFFERNKVTLGLFGTSILFSFLGNP